MSVCTPAYHSTVHNSAKLLSDLHTLPACIRLPAYSTCMHTPTCMSVCMPACHSPVHKSEKMLAQIIRTLETHLSINLKSCSRKLSELFSDLHTVPACILYLPACLSARLPVTYLSIILQSCWRTLSELLSVICILYLSAYSTCLHTPTFKSACLNVRLHTCLPACLSACQPDNHLSIILQSCWRTLSELSSDVHTLPA
jgi:hypothetical protein